jgi:triacylglycerol lipase
MSPLRLVGAPALPASPVEPVNPVEPPDPAATASSAAPGSQAATGPGAHAVTDLQADVEETLGCGRRLWLRGLVNRVPLPAASAQSHSSWWRPWGRNSVDNSLAPIVQIDTKVGGQVLRADVPVRPDGRFEAMFDAELPAARRGWRIARHQITCGGGQTEKCSMVLQPPREARAAVLVILPAEFVRDPQRFASSELALRLTPVLRRLHQAGNGLHALYYMATIPDSTPTSQAEVALATTALGWPNGLFVRLRSHNGDAASVLAAGLDRLRWLLSGALSVRILNLETGYSSLLPEWSRPAEDRASVVTLIQPGDDPWKLCEEAVPERPSGLILKVRPTRAGRVPCYPVVFFHGMLAFSTLRMHLPEDLNSFSPLRRFLSERGFRALFPQVAPTSCVSSRAAQLKEQILRWTDEPVNIIAHSMGGLDARYMVSVLGMADRIRSLTTVSTPHRGTFLVDWFLTNFRNRLPLLLALEAMGTDLGGFRDCRPTACSKFNEEVPDMPGVRYFSYGGSVSSAHVTPFLRRAYNLLSAAEGPNDGMVSLTSARWGEYLGTIHADHFAQTPDMTFVRPGETFDPLGFYVRIVEDLARRGF